MTKLPLTYISSLTIFSPRDIDFEMVSKDVWCSRSTKLDFWYVKLKKFKELEKYKTRKSLVSGQFFALSQVSVFEILLHHKHAHA